MNGPRRNRAPALLGFACAALLSSGAARSAGGPLPRPAPPPLAGLETSSPSFSPSAPLWGRAFGGPDSDGGYLVKAAPDGGYVLWGETSSYGAGREDLLLLKTDATGAVQWARTYGTPVDEFGSILPLEGGGFLLQGSSMDSGQQVQFFMARLAEDGSVQWQKSYGGANSGLAGAVPTADGGFLVSGFNFSFTTLQSSLMMVRLDSAGNILWQKQYSGSGQILGFFHEAPDGTILGSGTTLNLMTQNMDLWAARFDASGNLLWQKTYGGSGMEGGGGLFPLSGGGFILSGTTRSFGAGGSTNGVGDVWLLRLDPNGNILWQKTYGGSQDEFGFVQPVDGGGFFLAADTQSFGAGDHDLWLLRLDNNGGIVWQKTFGGSQKDELASALAQPDGTFLVAAKTESFGHGLDDVWVLKLNSSGAPLFQRAYGGSDDEEAVATRLSGGGLLIVGETKSFGAGNSDLLVLRTDDAGLVGPSCFLVTDTAATGPATSVVPGVSSAVVGSPGLAVGTLSLTSATMNLTVGTPSIGYDDLCASSSTLTASASGAPLSGTAPLEVNFTGSASGGTPPYSYSWDFGDGASSSSQNPAHTYAAAGTYPVSLTVTDSSSDSATDSHLSVEVLAPGCSLTCSAVVPSTAETGQAVSFSGSATASGCSGTPVYDWDFGDGSAHESGSSPTHVYGTAGTYTWTLTVTVSGASPCTQSGTLTVTEPSGGCGISCHATISAPRTAPGEPITFNAIYQHTANCSEPLTLDWDFGDGSPHESGPTVVHTYAAEGSYNWNLRVEEANGYANCVTSGWLNIRSSFVDPPNITSVTKKGNPFRFVVTGSNLQPGIQVYIDGQLWNNALRKSSTKLIIKGGASLKAAVPKETPKPVRFVNPDGGEITVLFYWS